MITCTRCDSTGYLNTEQLPPHVDGYDQEAVAAWIAAQPSDSHDVQVCDCCGNGEAHYGVPGYHYSSDDPEGSRGPYSGNGGLCHCH